jgi:hypothetical protein
MPGDRFLKKSVKSRYWKQKKICVVLPAIEEWFFSTTTFG